MVVYKKDSLCIEKIVLGVCQTNCYLIYNTETNEAIVLDPADYSDVIQAKLDEDHKKLTAILLTHGHFDHIYAVNDLAKRNDVKVYANEWEDDVLRQVPLNCSTQFGLNRPVVVEADVLLKDKEKCSLAGFEIQAIHTPGHTKGGCCYYFFDYGVLFSGDTLFEDSIGRYDLPTGDYRTLRDSITTKLFTLKEDTVVLPGHGGPTSIGYEKTNNML